MPRRPRSADDPPTRTPSFVCEVALRVSRAQERTLLGSARGRPPGVQRLPRGGAPTCAAGPRVQSLSSAPGRLPQALVSSEAPQAVLAARLGHPTRGCIASPISGSWRLHAAFAGSCVRGPVQLACPGRASSQARTSPVIRWPMVSQRRRLSCPERTRRSAIPLSRRHPRQPISSQRQGSWHWHSAARSRTSLNAVAASLQRCSCNWSSPQV